MNRDIIKLGNDLIRINDTEGIRELYDEVIKPRFKDPSSPCNLNIPHIFSKLFTNACLYNRKEIAEWLFELYEDMDPVTKIGLRPTFNYGRFITRKKEFIALNSWLTEKTLIVEPIKH